MCAPFGEDPSNIKGSWKTEWSQHKLEKWDEYINKIKEDMKAKGWDPNDPKNSNAAAGLQTQVARWQFSKQYDDKYIHGKSSTGRKLDDPSVTAPQAGAAASGRDQNLGAGGGTNPESNQTNPETNTNQSNKDKAGSKKSSKKENLKIPKPEVNLPNGNQSSGGVNY